MKKLRKVLAVVTALVLAVSMLGTVSFASDNIVTVCIEDTVVSGNYILTNAETGENETFSYTTPEGGVTVLIFFWAETCVNSQLTFSTLNYESWVGDEKVNVIAIESTYCDADETYSYLNTYAPNIVDDLTVYCGGYSLSIKYADFVGAKRNSGTPEFAFVVCIDDSGNIVSYNVANKSGLLIGEMVTEYLSDGSASSGQVVDVTVSGTKHYEYVEDIVEYANQIRANDGVTTTLTLDAELTELAMQRAAEIALFYSHVRPDGTSFSTVFGSYSGLGAENIAVGYASASAVSNGWDNSTGHHNNIVNKNATRIGVGCFESNGVLYWVQLFRSGSATSGTISASAVVADVTVSTLTTLLDLSLSSSSSVSLALDDTTMSAKLYSVNAGFTSYRTLLKPVITVDSSDGTILTIEYDGTGTGTSTLTGIAEGTGTITYSAYNGQTDGISVALTVSDHEWDNGTVTTPATCTTDGVMTYTCTDCGVTKTEVIPATGHTWNSGVTTDSTCEEDGYVTYTCTECGETKVEDGESALGHDYKFTEWVWATDYSSATAVFTCANDSTHTVEVDADVTATGEEAKCEEDGYMDYVATVTFEGETYTSEAQRVVLEMTGHTAGEPVEIVITEKTCTEDGVSDFVTYCTDCGAELSRESNVATAAGHTWNDGEVTTEPTCTEEGEMLYTCTACGETKTEVISALGHTWDEGIVTTAATCTEDGEMLYTCTDCGETKTEAIAATGHTWDEGTVTTPATCTEDGEMLYTCTDCGETKTEAIAATGHTWDEGTVTTPATCTEDGEMLYTCTDCGETKTETITATGHVWDDGEVTTEATATTDGVMTYTCTICGETKTETIPATEENHTYILYSWNWSSDLNSAVGIFYCSSCGGRTVIPATITSSYSNGVPTKIASIYYNGVWYSDSQIDISSLSSTTTTTTPTTTTTTPTTEETITVSDPIEDTNTKTEDEGETVSEPEALAETNPTTGVALSLVPLAIAALAIVSSKRK